MASQREQFGSRIGFILATAGSAVGIGNLVGFPVNATKNGGGAFLLLYAVFVLFICLPVMMAELAAGRHTQKNPLTTYDVISSNSKRWHIAGWLSVITPFMIAVFYSVITLWILGYLSAIVTGNLNLLGSPEYFSTFINSKSVFSYLIGVSLFVGGVLFFGVKDGIERGAKIMMPMLFIMLIGLVIFVLTRENAMAGVKYFLIPDLSKIDAKVINSAMAQAFFSLSLGMGILITYGSYMKRTTSIAYSAKMVALADTGIAFTAGLLVLPAIFSFNPDTNPAELSDSSIALIFTFLPKIFIAMQASIGYFGASAIAAVFFLLVLVAALTSLISIIEVPVCAVIDNKNVSRPKALICVGMAIILVAIFCTISFGMSEFFTNLLSYGGADKSFFDLVIDIFYDTILPLNGLAICALVIFRWKKSGLNTELECGDDNFKGSLTERYLNFSLTTFIPLILLFVFINTALNKFWGISLI